jgi:hypothetical protein
MVRRWMPALVLGAVWWWAVLRLMLEPEQAGLVEGVVAAGGWGLSLLPVHVSAAARSDGVLPEQGSGKWQVALGAVRRLIGEAWPGRRSDGGPGR